MLEAYLQGVSSSSHWFVELQILVEILHDLLEIDIFTGVVDCLSDGMDVCQRSLINPGASFFFNPTRQSATSTIQVKQNSLPSSSSIFV